MMSQPNIMGQAMSNIPMQNSQPISLATRKLKKKKSNGLPFSPTNNQQKPVVGNFLKKV